MDLQEMRTRLERAEHILGEAIVYPPSHASDGDMLDALLAVDSAHNIVHAVLEEWQTLEPSRCYTEEVTQFRKDAALVMLAHGRDGTDVEPYLDFLCQCAFGEGWRQ